MRRGVFLFFFFQTNKLLWPRSHLAIWGCRWNRHNSACETQHVCLCASDFLIAPKSLQAASREASCPKRTRFERCILLAFQMIVAQTRVLTALLPKRRFEIRQNHSDSACDPKSLNVNGAQGQRHHCHCRSSAQPGPRWNHHVAKPLQFYCGGTTTGEMTETCLLDKESWMQEIRIFYIHA